METRASKAGERVEITDYGLPFATRHQQMEQDRAPPVLVHQHQLAGQALAQLSHHRPTDCCDDDRYWPQGACGIGRKIWRLKTAVEISVEPKDSQDILLGRNLGRIPIWRLKTAVEISVEPKDSQDIVLGRNLGRNLGMASKNSRRNFRRAQERLSLSGLGHPFGGTCLGIWGSLGRKCLNRAKNYCCPALGIDLRGSIVLDQGG